MWSDLDERIARFDTPTPNAFYTLKEIGLVVAAIGLFYGLPLILIAHHPHIVDVLGSLQSFFVHGTLNRAVIIPNATGILLDLLIVYICLFFALPKRTIVKDRTVRLLELLLITIRSRSLPTIDQADKVNLRLYLLKLIFVPLMLMFWISTGSNLNADIAAFINGEFWNFNTYVNILFVAMSAAFFVDVAIFTFGYLNESKQLDNIVVSVDPTMSGWVVCLLCYPPFALLTTYMFGGLYEVGAHLESDFWWTLITTAGVVLLIIYAKASVDLFGRASNLTYRGLVTWGTYGMVRHPAYAAKVTAWILATAPFMVYEPWLALTIVGWSGIYILRALTEERHIKMVARTEYEAYEKQVPYRFIPYVI